MLDKILPTDQKKRKWTSVGLTSLFANLLTIWNIYGTGEYGVALFLLTPLFIGLSSTIFYGYNRELTKTEAIKISFLTLGIFSLGLMVFAIEGQFVW